jgi:hypothetical protein
MVLTEENTRFCQRSATPGCRASSDAISWYPISVGINAKTQRPIPKDAKRAPFGRLRTTNIDTLTQRNTHGIEPSTSVQFDLFWWYRI